MLEDLRSRNIKTILIHNSGKVASSTFFSSLNNSAPGLDIHHVHSLSGKYLEYIKKMQMSHGCPQSYKDDIDKHLGIANNVNALLHERDPEEICILSGFRDPFDRGISAVAHNFGHIFPDLSFAGDVRASQVAFLNDKFMSFLDLFCSDKEDENFPYLFMKWALVDTSIDWFDDEFSAAYDLDVNLVDIGTKPYVCFRHNGLLFIMYRFETLKEHLREICGLLPIDEFREKSTNIAAKKRYGTFLSDFRQVFRPRRQAWDLFYKGAFYQHFYPNCEPIVPCGDSEAGSNIATSDQEWKFDS